MRSIYLCMTFLCLSTFFVYAQENLIATTSEGRKVILKDDGTWSYMEEAEQNLTIVDFEVILREKNYKESRYNKDAVLILKVKNTSGQKISGYRINIQIQNGFGDILHTLQLTSGNSNLDNDEIEDANFVFEDNQFIDSEVYDSLSAYSKKNLKIIILNSKVLQSE